MNHESLQVGKPKRGQKHDRYEDGEEWSYGRIPKDRQYGQTKKNEICRGSNRSQGNRSEVRVLAAQNFRAAGNDSAAQVLSAQVLYREIDRIAKSNE